MTDTMKEKFEQWSLKERGFIDYELADDFVLIYKYAQADAQAVDVEAIDLAGYKRGFNDCRQMMKDEPFRFPELNRLADARALVGEFCSHIHHHSGSQYSIDAGLFETYTKAQEFLEEKS